MIWFTLAILTRLFWACTNVIDQYISRYFGREGTMALVILQNICALGSAAVYMMVIGVPQHIDQMSLLWIALGVAIGICGMFPYLRAVQIDEARHVVPLFEMTPVILIVLSCLFLGETMTLRQLCGAALIIVCGFGFVWDFNIRRLKLSVFVLMAVASFSYAVSQFTFRLAGERLASADITIFFFLGYGIAGLLMAAFMRRETARLIGVLRESRGRILRWEILNQIFWSFSMFCLAGAMKEAPTAGHVGALSGTQPVFVMILSALLGLVISHHFPKFSWDRDTKMKLALLAAMCCGIFMLQL